MEVLPDVREPQYRLRHATVQHVESDQFAYGHIALVSLSAR
jgi:hypothetical protein